MSTVSRERPTLVLRELVSLPLATAPAPAEAGPSLLLSAVPRTLRLRRVLPRESGRDWLLDVEVEVPAFDPEQLLLKSEGYLVDGANGSAIGVVEQVEAAGDPPVAATLLLSAGWFGRRRLRIDVGAVEALLPDERRLIVDESRLTPARGDEA